MSCVELIWVDNQGQAYIWVESMGVVVENSSEIDLWWKGTGFNGSSKFNQQKWIEHVASLWLKLKLKLNESIG